MTAETAEFLPCETVAALDIIGDGGDQTDVEFGRLQSEAEGECVIDVIADIGIEDDRSLRGQHGGERQKQDESFHVFRTRALNSSLNVR